MASKVKYDDHRYNDAKEKYEELAAKYQGASGIKIAQAAGSNMAENAGKSAANSATAAARSAGLNKAQSALAGLGKAAEAAAANYAPAVQAALNKQNDEQANALGLVKTATEVDKNEYDGKIKKETAKLGALSSLGQGIATVAGDALTAKAGSAITSDETLKNIYPDMGEDILNAFRNIRSVEFSYTPEAIKECKTEILPGVDKDNHMGVIAQDVEKVFPEAVEDNGSGHKLVDTNEMTMANTAAIAELARQLMEIKEKL